MFLIAYAGFMRLLPGNLVSPYYSGFRRRSHVNPCTFFSMLYHQDSACLFLPECPMRRYVLPFLLVRAVSVPTHADDLSRGQAIIENYCRKQAAEIGKNSLKEYRTK